MGMRKTLYTLCVNDYEPEITKLTFPLLHAYADKIEADFVIINERKWPDLPPVMEKFQVRLLSEERNDDWSIFFDADTLIHPEMWDVTALLHKDTTCSGITSDFSPVRFRPNAYFKRDGRYIGKGNWCAIFSDWCRDYYNLPDLMEMSHIAAISQDIFLTAAEARSNVMRPDHLIDDYIVSRNIARFGLKHTLIHQVGAQFGHNAAPYLWHQYLYDTDEKVVRMKQTLEQWGVVAQEVVG